jgi:hypothetical protein
MHTETSTNLIGTRVRRGLDMVGAALPGVQAKKRKKKKEEEKNE